ncbi:chromate transporter [Anaerosinus massiliensis]|uniref:chromate transporter n=1 Tax=Massilibacillus massiliensis TaxID=1806837 RepID=UPI000A6DCB20|nr:chromate transporter [Massilibacillus massiliensis]
MEVKEKKECFLLCIALFWSFFKLSPISFGGGFAMVPILEREIVEKKKWIAGDKIVDIFALAQSAPGAIATNSAIFVGYQVAGIPGAFAAMLGMVIPTFAIVILLATAFVSFQHNVHVLAALAGIRPVIVALIASAAYKMSHSALIDRSSWLICLVSLAVLLFIPQINIIFVILSGAFLGVFVFNMQVLKNKKEQKINEEKADL